MKDFLEHFGGPGTPRPASDSVATEPAELCLGLSEQCSGLGAPLPPASVTAHPNYAWDPGFLRFHLLHLALLVG